MYIVFLYSILEHWLRKINYKERAVIKFRIADASAMGHEGETSGFAFLVVFCYVSLFITQKEPFVSFFVIGIL